MVFDSAGEAHEGNEEEKAGAHGQAHQDGRVGEVGECASGHHYPNEEEGYGLRKIRGHYLG